MTTRLKFARMTFVAAAFLASSLPQLAWATPHQINVKVKGMVCAFCAQGITKKFSSEPAVGHVDVSLENHRVTLGLKDNQTLEDAKINQLLQDAGYTVEKIERQ